MRDILPALMVGPMRHTPKVAHFKSEPGLSCACLIDRAIIILSFTLYWGRGNAQPMIKMPSLFMVCTGVLLLVCPNDGLAWSGGSRGSPEFSITVDNVHAPSACTPSGWAITYDRTTTFSDLNAYTLTRYFVQYVNDELNFVHYWGSGYSAYVQDYWVTAGTVSGARAHGDYTIPLWTDTYHAESIEYILLADEVIWEIRVSLICEKGEVAAYELTSEPTQGSRDALPEFTENLVLALDDIPLYGNPYTQTEYLGTIEACQTFFITRIYLPRASISVWATESFTGNDILLFDGSTRLPIVDVADDYGQPDGPPVLEACALESKPERLCD